MHVAVDVDRKGTVPVVGVGANEQEYGQGRDVLSPVFRSILKGWSRSPLSEAIHSVPPRRDIKPKRRGSAVCACIPTCCAAAFKGVALRVVSRKQLSGYYGNRIYSILMQPYFRLLPTAQHQSMYARELPTLAQGCLLSLWRPRLREESQDRVK